MAELVHEDEHGAEQGEVEQVHGDACSIPDREQMKGNVMAWTASPWNYESFASPGSSCNRWSPTSGKGDSVVKVLIVSYTFPPAGGVGVQRVAKLVKYLPEFGVDPIVLTSANPSVPIEDATTLRDIPANTSIVRTRTLEPDYRTKAKVWQDAAKPSPFRRKTAQFVGRVFVPDPQILWLPAAAPALVRLSKQAHVVLVTAPPFSSFLLGPLSRVPFVLDYRDEWRMAASYEMHGGSRMTRVIDTLEPALARRATMIVTATEAFRENLLHRIPQIESDRVVTITNGYDPDDFQSISMEHPPESGPGKKLVMTYAGTMFRHTSPKGLFTALRILRDRDPTILQRLEIRFVGRIVPTELQTFDEDPLPCVSRLPYVPREDALRLLARSHLALVILDEVPHAEAMYPAKIFELMYLRRPLLALVQQGALSRLIAEHNMGRVVHPRDSTTIAEAIAGYVRAFERGELARVADPMNVERFHRRAIAERFADVLLDATRRGKSNFFGRIHSASS